LFLVNPRLRWVARLVAGFAAVALAYLWLFHVIEARRTAKGPWCVTFAARDGTPSLNVNQPALGIRDVQIVFLAARAPTNLLQTVEFDRPRPVPFDAPFGRCVFLDTTFLPGTVVLEAFGHQIQLLPRTLTINGAEHAWRSGARIELGAPPGTGRD
jgi:hypothetical protein